MPDVLTVFLNKDDDDDDEMGIGEFNAGVGGVLNHPVERVVEIPYFIK